MKCKNIILNSVFLTGFLICPTVRAVTPPDPPAWVEVKMVVLPETPSFASATEIDNNQAQEAALEQAMTTRWTQQYNQAVTNQAILNSLNSPPPPAQ